MKIVYRYIFASILKPLIFCTLAFFVLWLIYDLFDTLHDFISRPDASKGLILQFYIAQLPKIAQSVIPVAFLFTTLYVLAYLTSHRELIVMQSNGLNLATICWPFFLIAGLLTLALFLLNFSLTPRAEVYRRLIKEQIHGQQSEILVFRNVIYRNPETQAMWYIQKIDARNQKFENAEILTLDEEGRDEHKFYAKRGEFKNGCWNLEEVDWIRFDENGNAGKPAHLPYKSAYTLTEPPKQIIAALRPPDEMTWAELWKFITGPQRPSKRQAAPYITEHYYRMAYPVICFILCLFGIALATNPERRGVAGSVFNSIFILFGMLVWLHLSLALGKGSRLPAWFAAWNGIFVFGVVGFYLFARRVGWTWLWRAKVASWLSSVSTEESQLDY